MICRTRTQGFYREIFIMDVDIIIKTSHIRAKTGQGVRYVKGNYIGTPPRAVKDLAFEEARIKKLLSQPKRQLKPFNNSPLSRRKK